MAVVGAAACTCGGPPVPVPPADAGVVDAGAPDAGPPDAGAARTCADAGCAPNQLCEEPPGEDARCLEECAPGFDFDVVAQRCDPAPSCDPLAPGVALIDECAAQSRVCDDEAVPARCGACLVTHVEVDGVCVTFDCAGLDCEGRLARTCDEGAGGPACGACLPSHVEDVVLGECIDRVTCAELACPESCRDATVDDDAACVDPSVCVAHEVLSNGTCVLCGDCFAGPGQPLEGVTGVGNGGIAAQGHCVCEVAAGYFQTVADKKLTRCDADGDGFVNADVAELLDQPANDPYRAAQRCTVPRIDAFVLESDDAHALNEGEVATQLEVSVEALAFAYGVIDDTEVTADGRRALSLFEPALLDSDVLMVDRYRPDEEAGRRLREYAGGAGARFAAAEVTPLTKACNHGDDDLNLDGVVDVLQSHEDPSTPAAPGAARLWFRMAYFVELIESELRPRPPAECAGLLECTGVLVLREKKRALPPDAPHGLELRYDPSENAYWQQCRRSRDPRFALLSSAPAQLNVDFARWSSCDAPEEGGACHVDGHVAYDGREVAQGTARVDVPADGGGGPALPWPGMNHSSQFRCVSLDVDVSEPLLAPAGTPWSAANLGGDFAVLDCALPLPRQSDVVGAVAPRDPVLACPAASSPARVADLVAQAPLSGQHHFIAVRDHVYATPAQYAGGCIDEGAEWGPLVCIDAAVPNAPGAFGALFCGCHPSKGGDACAVACPSASVWSTRVASFGVIEGAWLCAVPSATRPARASAGTLTLHGEVPLDLRPSALQCGGSINVVDGVPRCDGISVRAPPLSYAPRFP